MKSRFVLVAGAAMWSCAVSAQPGTARPPTPQNDAVFYVANGSAVTPFGGQVDLIRGEASVMGGVVKDKPYSASSITESAQILADGNRIVNRNEAKVYRDSQGRTRREQTLGGLGVWQARNEPLTMITINDPVADTSYFVDPQRRVARELQPFRLAVNGEAAFTAAVPAPLPGEPVAGQRVFVERSIVSDVTVARPVDPNVAEPPVPFEVPLPPPERAAAVAIRGAAAGVGIGPGIASVQAFGATAFGFPHGEAAVEDLGEQVLEGVLARGTRRTQTIPAGAIGNERAIDIVAEEWYSAEIDAVVWRRNLDPRFGETNYRLVNLVRGEPSPELFTVPQDYEREDDFRFAPPHVEMGTFGSNGEQGASTGPPPGTRSERRVFLVQPGSDAAPK